MASTLDNNVYFNGTTNTTEGEIGDLGMAIKCLLIQMDTVTLSGGLAMTVPTAKGSQYYAPLFGNNISSQWIMTVGNQSVHLMPFVGGLWTPNDRLFAIGYVQFDVDVNGDPVTVWNGNGGPNSPPSTPIGSYRDATMLYADLSLGYWLRRSECDTELVTGLAPVVEVHMNQTLDSPSSLGTPPHSFATTTVTGAFDNLSILDLTVGCHVELHKNTTVTAGYCAR